MKQLSLILCFRSKVSERTTSQSQPRDTYHTIKAEVGVTEVFALDQTGSWKTRHWFKNAAIKSFAKGNEYQRRANNIGVRPTLDISGSLLVPSSSMILVEPCCVRILMNHV